MSSGQWKQCASRAPFWLHLQHSEAAGMSCTAPQGTRRHLQRGVRRLQTVPLPHGVRTHSITNLKYVIPSTWHTTSRPNFTEPRHTTPHRTAPHHTARTTLHHATPKPSPSHCTWHDTFHWIHFKPDLTLRRRYTHAAYTHPPTQAGRCTHTLLAADGAAPPAARALSSSSRRIASCI